MSNWDELSLRDKAEFIKVGVRNGLTSISDIKELYNKFLEINASAGNLVKAINENTKLEIYLGKPSHNYDFTQSEEWADAHGYYPDSRGHRDDRVKKSSHPTHPSRGYFKSMNLFDLSDKGFEDPNYILYGLNDGGLDPQAAMTYKGGIVLPELTVTPQGNYIYNSYDNVVNKFGGGGFISVEEYAKMSREERSLYVEALSSLQRRAFYEHLRQGSKKRELENRRSNNNSLTLNTSSKSNKGVEDAYMIMDAMTKSVSQSKEAAKALGMAAVTALLQSREDKQEKKQEAETFLNAAEVASGVLGLSKLFPLYIVGPKELRLPWYKQLSTKLSNFANDNTTNIANSLAGAYIDWTQLLSSLKNGLSTLENSIEAPISTGGLLQAYNVFPTTNRFGRFINPFLNFAGYTTNIYDVTKPFRSNNEESNLDTN